VTIDGNAFPAARSYWRDSSTIAGWVLIESSTPLPLLDLARPDRAAPLQWRGARAVARRRKPQGKRAGLDGRG